MPRQGNARGFMQGDDVRNGTWRRQGRQIDPDPAGSRAARRAAGIRGPRPTRPEEQMLTTTDTEAQTSPNTRITTVYLAARYSRRLELCGYRARLAEFGIAAPARWLDGEHQLDTAGRPIGENGELMFETGSTAADYYREKFATDDLEDVLAADALIAFTEVPRSRNSRGGRHVELGIALGAGKPIVIVGPRENVFCWLPQVRHFETWDDLLDALKTGWPRP